MNAVCRNKKKQVAQLWQRDRVKLDLINIQRYSQSHKIAFLGHPMGHQGQYKLLYEGFNAKTLCSRVSSRECQFYS